MIRRMFWLAAGVTIGVVAVRKVSQARSTLGPEGINRAVGQLSDSIGDFTEAVKSAMAERETDLRAALGVQAPEVPAAPDTVPPAIAATAATDPGSRRSRR